ncbi:MAG TPA: glycosyltransferase family 2 protein [Candidatus Sulfotelmatobacter sp.]|nr:glycosyltransferase family 2 protein [Candidatus Sulfotelmatobacter sp.]
MSEPGRAGQESKHGPAHPGITVVMVTRNRPALFLDAFHSVEAQTLRPLEVRVGDDGDPPLAWLPDVSRLDVTLLPVGARRAAAARNHAAARARGEILAFLDDDDRWQPDHLLGLAAAFEDPAVMFAWRDCAVIRETVQENGDRVERARLEIARDWDPEMMRTNDYLPPSAWAVRRSLFQALDGFDESFEFSEDWDFVLRAAKQAVPRRVPGVTVEVRLRESGNASADFGRERIACLEKLSARHGLPRLVPRTFWEVAQLAAAGW